ncbi:flagellar hook assembly protein FlgD [Neokomagataea anthophila]|uniref:flagellar hook assembly protein FlgD n=1 Tax=Neokomagataea anthophila TaxID=2826925 RepID=UPI0031FBB23F
MSVSVTSTSGQDSLLSQAVSAARSSATTAKNTSDTTSTTASSAGSAALSSIAGNFNQFLTLLTAQLQHQDPTNPTDSNNFTAQVAQFAGVQQQVQSNTTLSSLLSATQDSQLTSGASLIGKTTTATTSSLPLQNGQANLSYTAQQAGDVAIAVTNTAGQVVRSETVSAAAGQQSWHWDGKDNAGNQLADGGYYVAAEGTATDGTSVALPTTVSGTITGISRDSGTVNAQMGGASVALKTLNAFQS